MCIGLPMRIVSVGEGTAVAERSGECTRLDTMLLDGLNTGDWVLAFHGHAVKQLSDEEARATDAALAALEAVLSGSEDISGAFADLIDREPQLPDHLRNQ